MISNLNLKLFKYKWVGIIIFLATFLRFYNFTFVPPSLNWDEASLGYNAYSILKTGKDEWGKLLPLSFEAFGDFKLPVYVYTLVPFEGLFGLEEFAVRIPSQLAGVLSVCFVYLIVKKLSGKENWALISAFLLTISPWHLFLSRVALEANLALFLFLSGFFFLLKGLEKRNYLILSSILMGLTLFTYNSARIFVPLFLTLTIFIYYRELNKSKLFLVWPLLVIILFVGLAGYLAIFQDSSSRYFWVTILDEGAVNSINQIRGSSHLPSLVIKLLYNRVSYFGYHGVLNYLQHFSPLFLFSQGGSNYQFSVPGTGLMYWTEIIFVILGALSIYKKRIGKLLLLWLFLAPIPAAITRESPHVLRAIFMLGSLQMISAFGILRFYELIKAKINFKIYFAVVLSLLLIQLGVYEFQYFTLYPKEYSQSWQYGIKQAIEFVNTKENLNSRPLYITKRYGEAHIFYLFYNKYDPAKYQQNPTLIRYPQSNWRWVDRLDNVYFVNDWEMKDKLKDSHGYVITTPGNYPGIPPILKSIPFLDGKTAFEIVEI